MTFQIEPIACDDYQQEFQVQELKELLEILKKPLRPCQMTHEERKERERKIKKEKKDLKRARDMGISIEEYNKLDSSIRDRRKRSRKSNVYEPIPGVNFSYSEGVSKIFKELDNNLTVKKIVKIGKERGYWDHKLQYSLEGKCQITASVNLTLRKMVKRGELRSLKIMKEKHYFKLK